MSKIENVLLCGLAIILIGGCSKADSNPDVAVSLAPVVTSPNLDDVDSSSTELDTTAEGGSDVDAIDSDAPFDLATARAAQRERFKTTGELKSPVRLESDGEPIDIGLQQTGGKGGSAIAHAGPTIADVDGDGDCDLLVGDFPGNFWLFENENDDKNPRYVAKGKLQAGGEDARTPVY